MNMTECFLCASHRITPYVITNTHAAPSVTVLAVLKSWNDNSGDSIGMVLKGDRDIIT